MKVVKKIISTILGLIFVLLVVAGIITCTYVFNHPSRSGDSRKLIDGTWSDSESNVTFVFSTEGDFKMYRTDSEKTIAKGYFKVDEDSHNIKILVLPTDRDDSVNINRKMYFFSNLAYTHLEVPAKDSDEAKKGEKATCSFIFADTDQVYRCERTDNETNVYNAR